MSGYGTINSHPTIYIIQFELAVKNVNKKYFKVLNTYERNLKVMTGKDTRSPFFRDKRNVYHKQL